MEQIAYIGLGSSMGDRAGSLRRALETLAACEGIVSVRPSTFYETPPLGDVEQGAFLNGVAQVRTSLSYRTLFETLQAIEQQMGRVRGEHWGPRVIDLDLLLYGSSVVDEPDLKIPHPEMHLRSFVLRGLCLLDPGAMHPQMAQTVVELAKRLNNCDFYRDASRPQLVSIAGNIGVGKTTLAQRLAGRLNARFIAENYSDNPYLADVYAGDRGKALDSELFFLSSGASQLEKRRLKAGAVYVSDYVFDKAMIYASNWLNDEQMEEYKRYYASVSDGVAVPVLVIYLNDSLQHCLDRIHRRNRPYEQEIEPAFLEHLETGYETLYRDFAACPVWRITSDRCWTDEQVDRVAAQVRYYIAEATA